MLFLLEKNVRESSPCVTHDAPVDSIDRAGTSSDRRAVERYRG